MEVVYEGPRSIFNEFTQQPFDELGVSEYVITEGILKKGWVSDEIVRFVVQFDPDEAHTETEAFEYLTRWAKNMASSVVVRIKKGDTEGSDDDAVPPTS